MSGYARIHRTLLGHPAFRNDAEAMAFAWLVIRAQWKPMRVRYKERAIQLRRGQLAISQRDMAASLDRDKAWIERLWKRLRAEAMIKVDVEAGVAVITICNYANYQASEDRREAVNEAASEAGARQGQGTEQVKEEVKKEAIASIKTRTRFILPSDIPAEPFAAFEDMRKKLGKPLTDHARNLAVLRLRKLRDEDGWPPGDVLNNSTLNSYQGLFPPKDRQNGLQQQSSLRGTRPDPALDLYRAAVAEEQREDREADRGTRVALPAHGPH